MQPADRVRRALRLPALLVAALAVLAVAPLTAEAAPPATPSPLPAGIEAYQPYVGQQVCDPVAKPGVRAFSTMVLDAYRSTSSLGIVRDCGSGGQSEHKEGRGWDWGVNASDPADYASVKELNAWLMATDRYGNAHANLRRLGIMYLIWNKQIWKAYQPEKGWQPYSGASPHTDHVHFSFGWNGARQVTSFWDGTVAPVDMGPGAAPAPAPSPTVTPTTAPSNLKVLAQYGGSTLQRGSTGDAVRTIQGPLRVTVDGQFGSGTESAVATFQRAQGLTADGVFGPEEWQKLFPRPTAPYGELESVRPALGQLAVTGWALDAETSDPIRLHVYVDGAYATAVTADLVRDDVAADNPGVGRNHGYRVLLTVPEGSHEVCTYAINAPGTAGGNVQLGCADGAVSHTPVGVLESVVQGPTGTTATGWGLDPDVVAPVGVHLYLDGAYLQALPEARAPRSDVAADYPDHGGAHGFAVPVAVPEGTHEVCAWILNAPGTPGSNRRVGCRTVTVTHQPTGVLDPLQTPPGKVVVSGWALDRDSAASLPVQLLVDGSRVADLTAGLTRTDLPAGTGAYGQAHGYRAELVLAEGRHTVCATVRNASGTPGGDVRLPCRDVVVHHTPYGALESVTTGIGGVAVSGWALDPDVTSSITAQVHVDGRRTKDVVADVARDDVAARQPGYGRAHGVSTRLELTAGTHEVCLWAVNAAGTPGAGSARLGCRTVVVQHSPIGALQQVTSGPGGVTVAGWAIDPDTAAPLTTHLYVDGTKVAEPRAAVSRSDVGARYPAYGSAHGFHVRGLQLAAGTRQVCVWALNASGTSGGNVRLGCRDVVVRHDAMGALQTLTATAGGAVATGWALDPDTTASTVVHLYVDGRKAGELTASAASAGVARAYPAYGAHHGWTSRLAMAKGRHSVCAWSLNAAGTTGRNVRVGCKDVVVA